MSLLRGLLDNRLNVTVETHDGPDAAYVAIAGGALRRGDRLLWGGDTCFVSDVDLDAADPYLVATLATGPYPTIHLHHREEIFVLTPRPPTTRETELP